MKYAVIAAGLFAGDFFVKNYAEQHLKQGKHIPVWKGRIILQKYYNNGAALNFMEHSPRLLQRVCGGILLVLGVLWCLLQRKQGNPCVLLGLSMILGGGASNMHDRMTKGYVVDYFSFHTPWERLNRVVFNLSDLFIFLGSILIILFGTKE